MNKVPAKQIYLLSVIIVGIIALSLYSTYALFTFESSIANVVSIHTPKSLTISENVYEYQQIVVDENDIAITTIDIYNTFDYEVCYSLWYKIIGNEDARSKVQIFEIKEETLSTSGVLLPNTNIKVKIAIINDNAQSIKINIGTISASKQNESCSLNLSEDKQVVSSSYGNIEVLTTSILNKKEQVKESEAGYLTYSNLTKTITLEENKTIYISKNFTYENEIFNLNNAEKITAKNFVETYNLSMDGTYFCLDSNKCQILHKIKNIQKNEDNDYNLTKYDKLVGYNEGNSGLRKINNTDYVYDGDNPNNFIYYNCENNDNLESCELWRIVGFFYNEETKKYNTKIVRNESIGKYRFDYKMTDNINESTNNWQSSTLNKYLNEEYKLINSYDIYTEKYLQLVERIPNLEISVKNMKINDERINSQISLLSLSDYLNSSTCQKNKINEYTGICLTNSWLNNIELEKEWTLTSKEVVEEFIENEPTEEETTTEETENIESSENTEEEIQTEIVEEENKYVINYVYAIGENITENDVNESLNVRPVVFLKSRMVLLDGNGSLEAPYVVK